MDRIFDFNENEIETEGANGNVKISNDVIASIAGISAEETKGISHMYSSLKGSIAEKLGTKSNQSRGVKVDIAPEGINLDLFVVVDYGVRIKETCEAVQESVKNNVETMTGLDVIKVNVHVEGINISKVNKTEEDIKIFED